MEASGDIERQVPTQEHEVVDGANIDDHSLNRKIKDVVVWNCIVSVILCSPLIFVVLEPLYLVVVCSLPKKLLARMPCIYDDFYFKKEGPESGMAGIYNEARHRVRKTIERRVLWSLKVFARPGLLFLLLLALKVSVPGLKRVLLLGSPLWKWSLLGVTLTAPFFWARRIARVSMYRCMGLWPRREYGQATTKTESYYTDILLGQSMMLFIHLSIVLLVWLLYFHTGHGLMSRRRRGGHAHEEAAIILIRCVTWVLVSLFIGSGLWFLKGLLLMRWSEHAIYCRLETRILIAGAKFFCLGTVFGGLCGHDRLLSKLADPTRYRDLLSSSTWTTSARDRAHTQVVHFTHKPEKENMVTLTYIGDVLTSLAQVVRSGEDDCAPDLINWFHQKLRDLNIDTDHECEPFDDSLPKLFPEEYDKFNHRPLDLYKILRQHWSGQELTFDHVRKWMVDGHIECVNMGRTLADAKAIVSRLDMFLSCIILVALVLFCLLITGVASTKVIVTLATPILAFSFMFGDTAKAFFQGIIFYFDTHPFDVGDRCILDETELEVKSVVILTTKFIKIGAKDLIIHSNSVLATKAIVNLGCHPDPTDVVELTLDSSFTSNLEILEAKIEEFLHEHKEAYEESHEVIRSKRYPRTK